MIDNAFIFIYAISIVTNHRRWKNVPHHFVSSPYLTMVVSMFSWVLPWFYIPVMIE